MQAVPSPLYQPLRQALLRCAEFGSQRQLDAVFSSIDALSPFWDRLPTADDRAERVDVTIGYLIRNRRSTGENALVLFLRALSGNYDLNNELHGRLIALADQLEWALNLPRKPNREALEANPDQDKMIWTVDVEAMMRAARSVARIAVPRIRDGKESSGDTGTAWMVAPRLAITAWHVIEASRRLDTRAIRQDELDQQVNNALLTFDFTVYGKGIQYKAERIEYPTLATRVLDYAVLRLKDNTDYPLAARGYLRLDLDPALTSQTMLYIIQHPLGQPQQISGDHYVRSGTATGSILYKTPTEPGTSGSPVFNRDTWTAMALHTGEDETTRLREGTLIQEIMADLQQHRSELYDEILSAQQALRKE